MATDREIEDRRERVRNLLSRGFSQGDIARELRLTRQTISKDMKAINHKANQLVNMMAKEGLNALFESCIKSQNNLLLECWRIYLRNNEQVRTDMQVTMAHRLKAIELMDKITSNKFNTLAHGPAMMELNRLQSEVANLKRGLDITA